MTTTAVASHTPGPWRVTKSTYERMVSADSPNGRVELATIHGAAEYAPLPAKANACLIAAAPDLLEALKAAARFIYPDIGRGPAVDGWQNTIALVEDVLAKAEGRVQP